MVPGSKFHAYGNDFLIIEAQALSEPEYAEFSRDVCRPHFGIGADGCLMLEPVSQAECKLRIFNCDGTEAGMSGNGARCAAAYLHRLGIAKSARVCFRTSSGQKTFRLLEAQPPVWRYRSSIGEPVFEPAGIPIAVSHGVKRGGRYELSVAEKKVLVTPLSVGNPQCVVFVEDFPLSPDLEEVGRALETHPFFPERTNVSFVRILNRRRIAIRIWERGVGLTHSSGTGSSGAGVAAIGAGKVSSPVEVATETGTQIVEWEPSKEVSLTGEATFVAEFRLHWDGR